MAPLPVGVNFLVSGSYLYSLVASICHSLLNLNLLPYPPNTVPSFTISGVTTIFFYSVFSGGIGIVGLGVGYSGICPLFGNSVGGGIIEGLNKFIFLHELIRIKRNANNIII